MPGTNEVVRLAHMYQYVQDQPSAIPDAQKTRILVVKDVFYLKAGSSLPLFFCLS